MSTTDRQLLLSIVDYLYNKKGESENSSDVEESIRLIQQAFGIKKDDLGFRSQYAINTDLFTIFDSYVQTHHLNDSASNSLSNPSTNPELKSFLTNLEARGYFNGVNPSSEEYKQRYDKAIAKYLQHKDQTAPKPTPISPEVVSKCESLKEQGNGFFRSGNFQSAVDCYTEAIEMYNENPNKYIYLCNRATAAFYLNDYIMAEKDCKDCIALNPKHMKAYTRLAAVYQKLNRDEDAMKVCEDGLKVDGNFTELSTTLEKLKAKRNPSAGTQSAPSMNSFANILNSMASDPSIRETAQEFANGNMGSLRDLLNNPAVAQMANNVMSNPELLSGLMNLGNAFMGNTSNTNNSGNTSTSSDTTSNMDNSFQNYSNNQNGQ